MIGDFEPSQNLMHMPPRDDTFFDDFLSHLKDPHVHHKDMSKLIFRSQANPDGPLQPNRRPRTTVYGTLSQIERSKSNKIGGQKI